MSGSAEGDEFDDSLKTRLNALRLSCVLSYVPFLTLLPLYIGSNCLSTAVIKNLFNLTTKDKSHKPIEMSDSCSCFSNVLLPLYVSQSNIFKPSLHSCLKNDHIDLWSNRYFIYTKKTYSRNNASVRKFSSTSGLLKSNDKKQVEKTPVENKEMGSKEIDSENEKFAMDELIQYWETDRKERTELDKLIEMHNEWEKYDDDHSMSGDNMKYWELERKERLQQGLIVEDTHTANNNGNKGQGSAEKYWESDRKQRFQQQLIVEDTNPANRHGSTGQVFSVAQYRQSPGPNILKENLSKAMSEVDINSYEDKTEPCLTHTDDQGKADMVDIGSKSDTERIAEAQGIIFLGKKAFHLVMENKMKKGDVFSVSQLAGIMGAKKTSDLIPLCHNINLSKIDVSFTLHEEDYSIVITSRVKTYGRTGVEMEALTAVSLAALTVYDMCKAVTRDMVISDIKLVLKTGGQRGDYYIHSRTAGKS